MGRWGGSWGGGVGRGLIQIADVVGLCGVSFLPVFISVCVFHIASRFVRTRHIGWDALAAIVCLTAWLIYAHVRIGALSQVTDSTTISVSLVQRNVPQAEKFQWDIDAEAVTRQYQRSAELTREHAEAREGAKPVDLVVWPESAVPMPLFAAAEHEQYFNSILALGGFSLMTGTEVQMPDGPWHNSAVLMRGSFANHQLYHKAHLVPFGEFLPFRDTFPFSLLAGVLPGNFTPGTSFEPLRLEKPEIGIISLICFEDTIGRVARKFVRAGPQLIVNITNDGWFILSAETEIHTANSIFRAIELRRPMVRACSTGVTCVIDPTGRITSRLEDATSKSTFIEGVLRADIPMPLHPPITTYARWGDWFSVLCLVIAVIASLWRRAEPSLKVA
ncbi:MAG: apolipoprotein N-acyltransferase [Verrucomicrobiales bacterium]